ncbi:hypothetical protein GDO86_004683, partial [Hymenochirus boettgeri]
MLSVICPSSPMPLSLLFTLILANICSQVFTSQSGALKSARPPNLKRDESNLLTKLYRNEETIRITENGCINSPRFPNSYPRNLLLTWILSSPENTRIQLAFDSQFGLEEQENDVCRYDFVEVEEDTESSSVIRGRWCGHKDAPPRLTSKANKIKVTFKSDDHFVAKPGFKICYSLVEEDIPTQKEEGECQCARSPQKV